MMTCPSCSGSIPPAARFCPLCGLRLSRACPSCGAAVEPDYVFCLDCGASLQAGARPTPTTAPPPPVAAPDVTATAERRLVSVLFADLVGFTAMSEQHDAEEVRELLTTYFETCKALITRYGGVVEKFIGDAVMAVWGAPVAHEDDAERAVRAALDLVDAVAAMGTETGAPELRARAGVLTGEAAVTLSAVGQGMVAGDLVNTSSRIQAEALPGTVLVGDATRRATEAAVVYEDLGERVLKGKAEPVRVWQALRVVAFVGGALKSEGLEAPFVGRDRELRLIKDQFHASAEEHKAQLVSVVGIAGIGKSRLGWEFYKYIDGIAGLVYTHRGRCLAYGEGVTYWALAEMVRMRAGITEAEDPGSAREKLRLCIEAYVPDAEERRWVEPRLAQLLALEGHATQERADLFSAWRLFFERLADKQPTILLFEDMQWADTSLLEFIEYLLEWSRNHALYVVTLARPELVDRHPTWGAAKRNFTSIFLEPLPSVAMERLLDGLVPGLPDELREQILDRAEGVPLYAVETVRMLLDRGLLERAGSVYRLTGPVEDLEVPQSLHGLIAARLDGLRPEARRVLQDAAVLGKTFTQDSLAAIAAIPVEQLAPLLAELVRKEVLSQQSDPRSPERGQYGFLQDLVKRVAYETLSKRDRKEKHLAVAAWFEASWGGEEADVVEVVAANYLEAYNLAPQDPDAELVKNRAAEVLAQAGERAASLAANAEASRYFQKAAQLVGAPTRRAELLERAGEVTLQLGRFEQATALLEEAKLLFEEAEQTHPAARTEARLADLLYQQGHLDRAIERARRAHRVLAGDEPDAAFALVTGQFGRFLALAGDEEAVPMLEEALQLAAQLQLDEVYSQALSSRAIWILRKGRVDEAATLLRRALDVAMGGEFTTAAFRAWTNLGVVLESQDRYVEVVESMPPMLALARRKGDRTRELSCLVGVLSSLAALGRWDEAISVGQEAQAAEELEAMQWVASGLSELVPIYLRRGEVDTARQMFVVREAGVAGLGNEIQANLGCVEAELLSAEGRHAEAFSVATKIVDLARILGMSSTSIKRALARGIEAALELGDLEAADGMLDMVRQARPGMITPLLRGQAARLGARLSALRGDNDAAEAGFVAAIAAFRDVGVLFELGEALLELAEWLSGQGRSEEAKPYAVESRSLFEQLAARPWLDRVQHLLGKDPSARFDGRSTARISVVSASIGARPQ
jgi:class 3 adenylate cyclase/tetratricopeptide (TPR) repeat protein